MILFYLNIYFFLPLQLKEKIAGTAPAADKNQNDDTPGLSSSGSAIQVVPSTSSRSSLITPRARAQRQAEMEEAALESIQQRGEQLISLQKQMVEQMKPSGDREREAFVEWIRTVILDLEHSLWRRFQHRISNLTYQFIAENDKIKTTPASSSQGRQPFQPNSMSQASSSQWPDQPTSQVPVRHSQDPQCVAQHFRHQQRLSPYHQQHQHPEDLYTYTQLQARTPLPQPSSSSSSHSRGGMQASTPMSSSPSPIMTEELYGNQDSFHLSQFLRDNTLELRDQHQHDTLRD